MIKVSVFYPTKADAKFDMRYYSNKHLPLLKERFGDALKGLVIDRGIRGGAPNTPAPFVIVANLMFENLRAFQKVFRPNANDILGDIPNFTNIQARIQISRVHSG